MRLFIVIKSPANLAGLLMLMAFLSLT